jgi:hypothetical protein
LDAGVLDVKIGVMNTESGVVKMGIRVMNLKDGVKNFKTAAFYL